MGAVPRLGVERLSRKEDQMIEIHHINLPADDIDQMEAFYRDVVGLGDLEGGAGEEMKERLTTNVRIRTAFLGLGDGEEAVQLHLSEIDHVLHAREGQAVNPVTPKGHVALRTDDLEGLKKRLDENGVVYSDYGADMVNGWNQIFLIDPAGHVIEVHEPFDT
jgi:glyoxylase I family protein